MNKQFKVLTLIGAMGFCGAANAVVVDPNYSAQVYGQVTVDSAATIQTFADTQQTSAGGSTTSGDASSAAAAAFGGVPSMSAQATSFIGVGSGNAYAILNDTLTFHIAGGGSADVLAQISGTWTATTSAGVGYVLNLDGGHVIISGNPSDPFASVPTSGIYTDSGLWHVNDGSSYHFYAEIGASAWGGGSAYIDDPITFQLPSGVTFTSASGSTYASTVPEPADVWLLGSGLLVLIGAMHRRVS